MATLRTVLEVGVYTDDDLTEVLGGVRNATIANSTLTEILAQTLRLAAEETVQIDLGSIATVRYLVVETSARVDVRLGAVDATPIPVLPVSEGERGIMLLPTTCTSLFLSNPSATAAVTPKIIVLGLPT